MAIGNEQRSQSKHTSNGAKDMWYVRQQYADHISFVMPIDRGHRILVQRAWNGL